MFRTVHRRRNQRSSMAIDIAPLIDIVFILLIFFLVSTSFLRDAGIDVNRPEATHSRALESTSLRIAITASGNAYAEGRTVADEEIRQLVQEFLSQKADGTVILVPDVALPSGRLVAVMDTVKGAGAMTVAVATANPEANQ